MVNTLVIKIQGNLHSYPGPGISIGVTGVKRLPKKFKNLKHVLKTIWKIIKTNIKKGLRIKCNEFGFIHTLSRDFGIKELENFLEKFAKRKKRKKFTRRERWKIFVDGEGYCAYCGKDLFKQIEFHVDHKVPLKKGGTNKKYNQAASCEECNLKKGAK